MIEYNKIIVLLGHSGAGKDAIASKLHLEHSYNVITSHSTRPMRDYESQGNPYWFTTKDKMLEYKEDDKLIECREYNTLVNNKLDTWYYAVHKDEVKEDKSYVVVLDMLGLKEFKEYFGTRVIGVFINVDDEVREKRAILRGSFDKIEWDRRLVDDKIQFSLNNIESNCDMIVNNINLDKTTNLIINSINKLKD